MSAHHDLTRWEQTHEYGGGNTRAERGTRLVLWITLVTMCIEIGAGWWFNSMALLADGWHMSSHALAIGLSSFAYAAARRYADDPRFAFGTWKIEVLGGYTSALFLLVVAALMVFGAVDRLLAPQPIRYAEAMIVAVFGLLINFACVVILHRAGSPEQTHHHSHDHGHAHNHAHGDLNLKAATIHVLTDALTSVLAIAALAGGWWYGWAWLDPACALVGAVLVGLWARNLLRQTGSVLLDREMDHPVVEEIRDVVGTLPAGTQITDLHVWRVGNGAYACALSLLTHDVGLTPLRVREALAVHQEIVHATVEIHRCDECPPPAA
ncbi:MAG: CDF family Co(II)/Ni(II) efflux transporter DmeF [Azonexus sp.]|jgi:cation diffusion facilitator family transporter|uniref:CDF family Co(II)/Ni(II) efflux transporter DmeF n=1 Tax=Azonexus sp. TaxID=1872668 RepID=UPI0028372383|nr:CDF family Co(II)/Ni(II) efflux transporter DmeF [Azonexus sp.]MDR0777565.1 CDF family Co(II)/Ni(II) efflux transporter DmeF [Azonexus sp.]